MPVAECVKCKKRFIDLEARSVVMQALYHRCKKRYEYRYGLCRGGEIIDVTSLDEQNKTLAEELFFEEFGHTRQKGDVVMFLRSYEITEIGEEVPSDA